MIHNTMEAFIDAEDNLIEATQALNNTKEALIEELIQNGRYDMFTLNLNRIYRECNVAPKRQRQCGIAPKRLV